MLAFASCGFRDRQRGSETNRTVGSRLPCDSRAEIECDSCLGNEAEEVVSALGTWSFDLQF